MTTHIDTKTPEVKVVDDTTIEVNNELYKIVSPTENIYPEKEYIDWNGAYWVKV